MHALDDTFVGREREVEALTVCLERMCAGQGRLVMISGEPGIGKTRLSQEIGGIAAQQGATLFWGRCYDQRGAPPYWPWVQVLRHCAQRTESDVLLSHMGIGAADIAEIVPELKSRFSELGSLPPLDPEQARFRLFDSVMTFLQAGSQRQPIVLVLENLHWADRSSLLLLEFVAREIESAHLLLIGSYRDVEVSKRHPLSETLGRLVREPACHRLELSGLNRVQVEQLLKTASGVTSSSHVVETVYKRTAGNPFFVTQIAQLIAQEGGEWSGDIPQALRDAIGQQLSRLSDTCHWRLTVAAVMGQEFEFSTLEHVAAGPDEDLLDVIDEALEARVVETVSDGLERYQFRHALIRQTLTDRLSPSRKVRLHVRIAEALEAMYGEDANAHATELAYHFIAAEPVLGRSKAIHYARAAGEQALGSHAYDEALFNFQYVVAAKHGQAMDRETAELHFGLARALGATLERPQLVQASEHVQRAFDYFAEAGDVARAVEIAVHQFGTIEGTDQRITRALELVPPNSHEAGRLLSHSLTVLGCLPRQPEDYTRVYSQALSIARTYGDRVLEMQTLVNAGCLDGSNLRLHECMDKHLQAIELAAFIDQPFVETHARIELVSGFWSLGKLDKARRHTEAACASAKRSRNRWCLAIAMSKRQTLSILQGDWEAARRFGDQGLEMSPQFEVLLSHRAVLECQVGHVEQSDAYLNLLQDAARLDTQSHRGIDPNVAVPIVARMTGNLGRIEFADEINTRIVAWPAATPWYRELARVGLALTALQRGNATEIDAYYHDLGPIQGRMPLACPHISGDRLLGLLAHASGSAEVAAAHFEAALVFCKKANYRPEWAWTCYDYACLLTEHALCGAAGSMSTPHRDKAATLLEEALAMARELVIGPLQERAAALHEQLLSMATERGNLARSIYPDSLTRREVEVLRLLAEGKTNAEIASKLIISPKTVTHHVTRILSKIGASNRTEAATYALRNRLVSWQ